MTAALLAAYAAAAGFGGPAVLRRSWLARVPAIAITLWLTLAASWVVAITLAALTLAMPSLLTWRAAGGHAIPPVSQIPGAVVAGGPPPPPRPPPPPPGPAPRPAPAPPPRPR